MKTETKSKYEIQAETFLEKAGITYKPKFLFHGPHWEGEKEFRNVWELTLERFKVHTPIERFSVRFGASINDSKVPRATKANTPTAYDFLACITKNDPGTFEDWCGEFGYNTDSRKAEKTYFAVQEEWTKVRSFFSAEEIEKLQEIQ